MKWIGLLLWVAAGVMVSQILLQDIRRRPRELRALRTAVQRLETEISYGDRRLPELFSALADEPRPVWQVVFGSWNQNLRKGRGKTVAAAWQGVRERVLRETSLSPSDVRIIDDLAAHLGRSPRNDQQRHLELAMARLEEAETGSREFKQRNQRLYNHLGFLLPLMIGLLFI